MFVESNCKLKRSRWAILLNTEKGQAWQQQCQHALWTFTWQGRTPIRLSRASSHDVTMTTCIRAIVYECTKTVPNRLHVACEPSASPVLSMVWILLTCRCWGCWDSCHLNQVKEERVNEQTVRCHSNTYNSICTTESPQPKCKTGRNGITTCCNDFRTGLHRTERTDCLS